MWVMSATTGMMFGAQYFQADDKPLYVQLISLIPVFRISVCTDGSQATKPASEQ